MWGGPPVRLDIYSIFLFIRGKRGGHARFWYRIGTDDPTKMTINDYGEERVCVRHEPRIPLGSDYLSRDNVKDTPGEGVCEARASHSLRH